MLKEAYHIAVPTAFFEDESLNFEATIAHIKHLYKKGVKSVFVSGTTGEQHSLYLKEKLDLIDRLEAEEELINNMEIIFGVSSTRQKEAEELAEKISDTRISGIMIGYPPYIIPTQEEALNYTKAIIQMSNKPTILYNNPKRTGFDLSVESVVKLSAIDLVIGIKEAGNIQKVEQLKKEIHRSDFHYYAGGEVGLEERINIGFDRLSAIAGNVAPVEINNWFQKLLHKEPISKQEINNIDTIMEEVYQGNAIVNVKRNIHQNGIPLGTCRSPIGTIS